VFSLLWGLLFRPRTTIEYILQNPNVQQASRLNFLIVMLLMINTIFIFATDDSMAKLGWFKWVIAFLLPPFQFWLQRVIFLIAARLGLTMFASKQMPRDPVEKHIKLTMVKLAFPYVVYPMLFCSIIASLFSSQFVQEFLYLFGLILMFLLTTYALKTIYGVSTSVAFWGPFLVQFLIGLVLFLIVLAIVAIVLLNNPNSFAP
jgi:hypothetical protein